MIVVFWLEESETDSMAPAIRVDSQFQIFEASKLSEALKFAESLRARRNAGSRISHVCLQSEMPESVGQAGVSDPPKDYAHYKRRIDPSIPLGRPSGDDIPVDFSEE